MPDEIRVLSVGTPEPYVTKDVRLLEDDFHVTHIEVEYNRQLRTFIKDGIGFSRMVAELLRADVSYFWFANLHAYVGVRVAERVGTPTAVTVGGFEVAHVPQFDYGGLLDETDARRTRYVLEHADSVLVVDDGLKRDAERNLDVSGSHIKTVPTGYDPDRFKPGPSAERDLVLTVAAESKWNRARLKGLDTFVTAAAGFEDAEFVVVGVSGDARDRLRDLAPPNVTLVKPVPQDELVAWYQRAQVYCQLSFREGLPNSLCEAMLCGCTPVGTDVQGIRTAIGDVGALVPFGDVEATRETIREALQSDGRGGDARVRILDRFHVDQRKGWLTAELRRLARRGEVTRKQIARA